MEVRKIIATNFKSIRGRVEFDFEAMKGVWKIGGSVGAGKTTIGEAILFGLFGDIHGKNNTDLVSWGEKKGFVEVFCTSRHHNIYIKREFRLQGQSMLYVEVDGEEITFTNKRDAQNQLEKEYYDVSKMTLELLCIISFNNFKSLASLNTQDTKAFLDQVFGFYVLTKYGDICKEMKCIKDAEIQGTNNNIRSIQSQIDKITQLSGQARVEGDLLQVTNDISNTEARRNEEIGHINDTLISLRKRWSETQTELSRVKLLGQNKKKEIDFIKQGKCPTCGAPIDQSQLSIKEQEREQLLSYYKKLSEESEIREQNIRDEEARKNEIEQSFRQSLIELRTKKTQLEEQEKRLNINQQEIVNLSSELNDEKVSLSSQEKDSDEWKMLYDIITSDIRQKILASFIPLLNQSIGFYTSQLHLPYNIKFDESFKCSINLSGLDRVVPISSLSTGQLKTVDISIILGVLKTIMNNVNFNISFLDELISNMDSDLRDIICKVLKSNIKPNQTVFIISHVDMNTDYFDGVIEAALNYLEDGLPQSTYNFTK